MSTRGSVSQVQSTVPNMGGEVPPRPASVLLGGGIGSGKSSVGGVFADAGFILVLADAVGHEVLERADVVAEVGSRWPSAVEDDVVDRRRLADVVFREPVELAALEAITHPRITAAVAARLDAASGSPVVIETPIPALFEDRPFTRVAVVADRSLRLARCVARGDDRDDVERRMASQVDDAAWRAWADMVIDNSGSWSSTERSVQTLIGSLLDG